MDMHICICDEAGSCIEQWFVGQFQAIGMDPFFVVAAGSAKFFLAMEWTSSKYALANAMLGNFPTSKCVVLFFFPRQIPLFSSKLFKVKMK